MTWFLRPPFENIFWHWGQGTFLFSCTSSVWVLSLDLLGHIKSHTVHWNFFSVLPWISFLWVRSSDTVENVSSQSVQFKDKGSSGAVGDGDFVSRISDFSTFNRSSTRGKSSRWSSNSAGSVSKVILMRSRYYFVNETKM